MYHDSHWGLTKDQLEIISRDDLPERTTYCCCGGLTHRLNFLHRVQQMYFFPRDSDRDYHNVDLFLPMSITNVDLFLPMAITNVDYQCRLPVSITNVDYQCRFFLFFSGILRQNKGNHAFSVVRTSAKRSFRSSFQARRGGERKKRDYHWLLVSISVQLPKLRLLDG